MTPKISSREAAARAASRVGDEFPELADLAFLLDSRWRIPVIGFRFGVDAVAGLLPVVGDLAAGLISVHIVHKAYRLGAPRRLILQMAGNVALDVAVGSIPLAGTVFDIFFKANNVNVRLLREHLAAQGKRLPPPLPEQKSTADLG
ncbi:DUF4112 domain-containing protein [Mesorhizobium australicum]|uniref:DUF4112 domain-containing protein n=1 Tax=Mesorhizobium australicum TaxID=536018 RepID=A0A1X7NC02_9HYPH|nr:DUF4112 domain-containing protein [Mesorhizobium australicum]SMH34387.1 protein of unknown function [Mesorhizobium australicum]